MARAAGTWPIQADHCFMRVCLDTALGARWDTLVARPAIRHLTNAQLQAAIAQAQAIIDNPNLLPALNQQSLHLCCALSKSRKLSVAAAAAIRQAHTDTIAPIAERLNHAAKLERTLSAIVNAAYHITPEEEALIWRTAPPRMTIPNPTLRTATT